MKQRKYARQFQTIYDVDPRTGRETHRVAYIGAYYRQNAAGAPALRKRMTIFAALFLALLVLSLFSDLPSSRCAYVTPFAAVALFPGLYLGMGLFRVSRASAKMNVVEKEESYGRCVRSAFGALLLAGFASAGQIVFLCVGGAGDALAGELGYLALLLMATACISLAYRASKTLFDGVTEVQ